MERTDALLIERLVPSHPELSRLMKEHRRFETRILVLNGRRWLSMAEQGDLSRLKKMKLRGRDRIEEILVHHRTGAHA